METFNQCAPAQGCMSCHNRARLGADFMWSVSDARLSGKKMTLNCGSPPSSSGKHVSAQTTPTREADALFAKQDWAGAARAYQIATGANAADGRAWFRLGGSLSHLRRQDESRTAFQHAIDNRFQPPYAMALIARAWASEKNIPNATEWLDRAATAGFALPTPRGAQC